LSRPDALAVLPRLPRDDGGPVFAEPWQAQAFALAVKLSEQGHFTWKEWAAALADQLQAAAARGEPDDGSRYYEHWLTALERLVAAKGLLAPTTLLTRKEAWADAYRTTPHGQPVELQSRAPDARWLLLGLAGTIATWWMLQRVGVGRVDEGAIWTALRPSDGSSIVAPVGFAASAGLGLLLGMRHALEPDHLAAVSTLMTGERTSTRAAWLGACWGLGHTLTLFMTGALLVMFQAQMPAIAAQVFECAVVLLLIGFGVRAIVLGAQPLSARPSHSHGRRPFSRFQMNQRTLARPLLVGAVHGLAGSGALIAFVVTALPSTATRLGYLMLFGVGSTIGMVALSGVLGWTIARRVAHRYVARTFSLAVGCTSTALGLFWGYPLMEALFQ
jgi:nitrile hydratase accessory protein